MPVTTPLVAKLLIFIGGAFSSVNPTWRRPMRIQRSGSPFPCEQNDSIDRNYLTLLDKCLSDVRARRRCSLLTQSGCQALFRAARVANGSSKMICARSILGVK